MLESCEIPFNEEVLLHPSTTASSKSSLSLFRLSYLLDALQSSLYLDQIVKVRGGRITLGCPNLDPEYALLPTWS